MTKRPIRLGYLDTATGEWKVLAHYSSYERADAALERYSERYPNSWVEILDGALTAA